MAHVDLLVGQGGCILVWAQCFAAMVVGVCDFGVLFIVDGGALCPVALLIFLAWVTLSVLLFATVEGLTFLFDGCPWLHACC